MTAREMFDLVTHGGGKDFEEVVSLLNQWRKPYCLIGGHAINAYVNEALYSPYVEFLVSDLDLDFNGYREVKDSSTSHWKKDGSIVHFEFWTHPEAHGIFNDSSILDILGVKVRVAALEDAFKLQILAWEKSRGEVIKHLLNENYLLRIAEKNDRYKDRLPEEIRVKLEARG